MRRYHIQDRADYAKYNKLAGSLKALAHRLSVLPPQDPFRHKMEANLLNKVYDMGILSSMPANAPLSEIESKVTVSAFCRRRLAVIMCANLKMAESVSAAVKFIEQGHVRVGPDRITDPAFLVTRCATYLTNLRCNLIFSKAHGGLCHMGGHLEIEENHNEIQ